MRDLGDEEERVRAVLTAQVETDAEWRLARAEAVLRWCQEKPTAVMWAKVELDTADLRVARNDADVEAKVLWWTRGLRPPDDEAMSDET